MKKCMRVGCYLGPWQQPISADLLATILKSVVKTKPEKHKKKNKNEGMIMCVPTNTIYLPMTNLESKSKSNKGR